MANTQELDWGSIEWIFEPSPGSRDTMHIGLSHMRSGCVQPRHIHSGDEQFMYILSGHGRQKIGDVEQPLQPGAMYHISAGTSHESINDSGEDIVKILVSVPAALGQAPHISEVQEQPYAAAAPEAFLRRAVAAIEPELLAPLKLPVSIYDVQGARIYCNHEYPPFCRTCCDIESNERNCPLYREKKAYEPPHYSEPSAFVCPYGLSLYVMEIRCNDQILGLLRAGHIRTETDTSVSQEELPFTVPHSTVIGVVQVLRRIGESISEIYRFQRVTFDLEQSQQALSDGEAREEILQASLRTSQSQAANLQINQHFLFNTLNMMMSTAIREGAEQTYEALAHLSALLQYTLHAHGYFTLLRKEVDYLKTYTALQKFRFGDRLEVEYHVDPALLSETVPLNFLQPIVENCFKHAFSATADKMRISIHICPCGDQIEIRVTDNGCGMDAERLAYLKALAQSGDADHGTAMVMRKLDVLYGRHCSYDVVSGPDGTTVMLRIPRQRSEPDETSLTG